MLESQGKHNQAHSVEVKERISAAKLDAVFNVLRDAVNKNLTQDIEVITAECNTLLEEAAHVLESDMEYIKNRFAQESFYENPDPFSMLCFAWLDDGRHGLNMLRTAYDVIEYVKAQIANSPE